MEASWSTSATRRGPAIATDPGTLEVSCPRGQGPLADALAAGYRYKEAYFKTLKMTGEAVAFTGLTLAFGVATWLWSGLQFQRDMGKLLMFMFIANMFGALLLLPAIATFLLKPKELAPGEQPVFKPRH